MKSFVKQLLIFLCWTLLPLPGHGQGQDPGTSATGVQYQALPIPPTPNAASLGKFGAVPVNMYTGLPTIQVPLYVIQQGTLSVPIALAYHSAIKVAEIPSWVGLGWALQAGGAITQTTRGASDQSAQGYWYHKATADSLNPRNLDVYHYGYQNFVAAGRIDLQPDSYFYNLPLGSGQLLFTDSTHAGAVGERGLLARYTHGHFELLDRAGTRYILGDSPDSRDSSISDDQENPPRGGTGGYYLTSMISANQQDTIRFRYSYEEFDQDETNAESAYYQAQSFMGTPGPDLPNTISTITQHSRQCQLQEIRWRNGRVTFTAATPRPDLAANSLSQLDVYTSENVLVKSYAFSYGAFYSNTDPTQAQAIPGTNYQASAVRLKLLAVTEQHGSEQLPGYRFTYYEHRGLPARTSYQQDHWGFANLNSRSTLLPATFLSHTGGAGVYPNGGSREPDFSSALAGVLRQITYPTGGRTLFTYEPHRVSQTGTAPATSIVATQHPLDIKTADFANVPYGTDLTRHYNFTLKQAGGCKLTYALKAQGGTGAISKIGFILVKVESDPSANKTYASQGLSDDGRTNPQTQKAGQALVSPSPAPMLNLPAGQYGLVLTGSEESPQVQTCQGNVTLTLYQTVADSTAINQGVIVGGTRIKRITDIASSGADSTVTHYDYTTGPAAHRVCSGVLVKNPIYDTTFINYYSPRDEQAGLVQKASYTNLSSSALAGIGTTQGSHVGYGQVRVSHTNGTLDNGYDDYTYTTAANYPDLASLSPYAPPTSRDFLRGSLVRQQSYSSTGQLLRRVRSLYTVDKRATEQLSGVVLHRIASDYPAPSAAPSYARYRVDYFRDQAQWKYESQRLTTVFNPADSTQQFSQQQYFFYDNPVHGLLTQTRTQGPAGEVRVSYRRYPPDYPTLGTDSASAGLQQLQQAHVWSPVLEQSEWVKPAGRPDSLLVSSQLHTYRPRPGRPVGVADCLYALALTEPAVAYKAPSPGIGGWQQDERYEEREHYRQYDAFDNLTWVTRANRSSSQVLLWGHAGTEVLAHATNCQPQQLASTSFEDQATGRWCYDSTGTHRVLGGRTGSWAYQLNGTGRLYRNQLPAGAYLLDYWVQGVILPALSLRAATATSPQLLASTPADWHQYRIRVQVTGPGEVSLDVAAGASPVRVDEVRLYPAGSLLTSYTHAPLVGETSQTGPDGRPHTYEYDAFNRLICTRDEQGRILSQQQYHYAGQ